MRSLLIEERGKTWEEKIENLLIKIWPSIYGIINGFVGHIYTTIRRSFQIVLEQIGLTKRRYRK